MNQCIMPNQHKKVVLIGIDGTYVPMVEKMIAKGELPTLKSFQNDDYSAWTLDAMTIYPPISGPAWTSLFYSKPPQYLGGAFFDNLKGLIDPNSGYLDHSNYKDQKSLFNILDEHKKNSTAIGGWERLCDFIDFGNNGCNLNSRPVDSSLNIFNVITDQIRDAVKLPAVYRVNQDSNLTNMTIAAIENDYDFIFTHFSYSDTLGHEHGIDQMYKQALIDTDNSIGQIMDHLDFCTDHIIIVSDHGRNPGFNHRMHDQFHVDAMTIPYFIKGPMVEKINLSEHPVSILDTTPTILQILGISLDEYQLDFFGRALL